MTDQVGKTRGHGHGHVNPNPDGSKTRCGGPGFCRECSEELAALTHGYISADDVIGTMRIMMEQNTRIHELENENVRLKEENGNFLDQLAEAERQSVVRDLAIFLARAHMEWHELRAHAFSLPPERCLEFLIMQFPVIQGTRNQLDLEKVGALPYAEKNIRKAVDILLSRPTAIDQDEIEREVMK